MFLAATDYMAGMGLRRNSSAPGELKQFKLYVTIDPQCYPRTPGNDSLYRPIYLPGTTNPRVGIWCTMCVCVCVCVCMCVCVCVRARARVCVCVPSPSPLSTLSLIHI